MSDQTPSYAEVIALVQSQLSYDETAFSIGIMGAIGEYFGPSSCIKEVTGGRASRDSGSISVCLPEDVKVIAYETVSGTGARWSQGVLFTYPKEKADLDVAVGLNELSGDKNTTLDEDKNAILFDLGLGHSHFSFAIKTDNKNLIAKLRDAKGRDLFTKAPNVLKAVMELEPDRVVQSFAARIVTKNPYAELSGPHTHLVPGMIGATPHASTLPVPDNHIVGLSMIPKSPWILADGKACDFNMEAYEAFQVIFEKFAPMELRSEKTRLLEAISTGMSPDNYEIAADKPARLQARATLRQLQQTAANTSNLKEWFMKLDRTGWVA